MDLVAPEDLPDYVPGQVLACSSGLGWKGLSLRSYGYKGQDVMVPAMRDFMLVAYRKGVTPMRRRFDGRWSRETCGPGAVSLLTRSQVSHWAWSEDVTVDHLYLTEKFFTSVASEVTGKSVAEIALGDILRTDDPVITAAMELVSAEARSSGAGGELYVESVGRLLVIHLLRKYASVRLRQDQARGVLSCAQKSRVQDFIEDNLDRSLGLAEIAAQLDMTAGTLARQFRRSFGMAPYAFVTERRLLLARRLLEAQMPAKQVAASCGFSDQAHLTRMFARRFGLTPATVRRAATRAVPE